MDDAMKKIFLSLLSLFFLHGAEALPSMVSDEEDWLHSDAKHCIMKNQSRLDHRIVLRAEKGDRTAQLQLATYLLTGTKLPYAPKQAYQWLEKAAHQGSGKAMMLLAAMHESGKDVKQDIPLAARYYRQAIEAGELDAVVDLARLSHRYSDQLGQEAGSALALLKELAYKGNPAAQLAYGLRLMESNQAESRGWLIKAAMSGETEGYYYLALQYLRYEDVSELDSEALLWLKKQDNEAKYIYLLGLLYHFGYGVKEDSSLAQQYLESAQSMGYGVPKALMLPPQPQ